MERTRQSQRPEELDAPPLSSRPASSGCEDQESDALLDGFFTERSAASTARDTARSAAQESHRSDDDGMREQTDMLHSLGQAVDLAYADYIAQQRDSEASNWSSYGGDDQAAYEDDVDVTALDLSLDLKEDDGANRVIQFDVGGRMFRCKASIVSKYPDKRLHRIVSSGSDRFEDTDTFFIDRSAGSFEIILDWYRTGRVSLPPGVSQEALEADARFFDVYDEMFPTVSDPESRRSSADPSSDAVGLRFSTRERHCLTPTSLPLVYRVRSREQLVVTSVNGHGKLMVRVCDRSGMQTVHVDQAVLFDSKTRFYLDGDQAQQPLNAMLPGDFVYTLWVEPHANEDASKKTRPSGLDIELDLLSTYSKSDLVEVVDSPTHRQQQASPRWEQSVCGLPKPVLFLPPSMQSLYDQGSSLEPLVQSAKDRYLGVERASRSPKPKINFVARAAAVPRVATLHRKPPHQGSGVPSSPIRRAGAAIISPAKPMGTGQAEDGKITIHRPDKLDFIKP